MNYPIATKNPKILTKHDHETPSVLNDIHNVKSIDGATRKVNRYTDSYGKIKRYYDF